jgi:glutamate transport system substrate-binding protein
MQRHALPKVEDGMAHHSSPIQTRMAKILRDAVRALRPLVWKKWFRVGAAVVVAAIVLIVLVTYVVDPGEKSEEELLKEVEFVNPGFLTIGVFEDAPFVGKKVEGKFEGFDIEIARRFANKIGFNENKIRWETVTIGEREAMIEGRVVDFVIAAYSITPPRRERVDFAGPYLLTGQKALLRQGLDRPDVDLRDVRVCTAGASTAEEPLRTRGFKNVTTVVNNSACAEGLKGGNFDAYITDEVLLRGFLLELGPAYRVVTLPVAADERWGIGVSKKNPALRRLLDDFLLEALEARQNGAWLLAYNKHLSSLNLSDISERQPKPEIEERIRSAGDLSR